LLKIRFITIN